MAFQAGNFTASQLSVAILKADKMWADPMLKADYVANVEIVKALRAEQSAKVVELENPEKDQDVKVNWITVCGAAADDDDDEERCDIGGDELGVDSKNYALTVRKKYGFTVNEDMFRTNTYSMEEVVARGFLEADKVLSESIAQTAVAKLDSFKGINQTNTGIGTVVGHETEIQSADWTARLFAYIKKVGILNSFGNPFLISGDNLFEDRLVTMLSEANASGKGEAALYSMIRTYFDLFNIDTVLSPLSKTFLVNRGAVAFASKSRYGAKPVVYKSQDRYSIQSRNLEGVSYDVYYTNRCTNKKMYHDFTVRTQFDWLLNPAGCNANKTGVLSFKRV